jgi:DNA-binding phage protein
MDRRSEDWNKGLADDLQDREFAKAFLLAALEEGIPIRIALAKVIRSCGVEEFAAEIGLPRSLVNGIINHDGDLSEQVLDCLLKPFDLQPGFVDSAIKSAS